MSCILMDGMRQNEMVFDTLWQREKKLRAEIDRLIIEYNEVLSNIEMLKRFEQYE